MFWKLSSWLGHKKRNSMHPALIVIIGVMGPLCLGGLIGIFYLLYDNKKRNSEHGGQIARSI